MGRLWDLYEGYLDSLRPFPPSQRKVAEQVGISPSALGNWRNLARVPHQANLAAFAKLIHKPYRVVLEAALIDAGYMEAPEPESPGESPGTSETA